jgi:hypothetical protein
VQQDEGHKEIKQQGDEPEMHADILGWAVEDAHAGLPDASQPRQPVSQVAPRICPCLGVYPPEGKGDDQQHDHQPHVAQFPELAFEECPVPLLLQRSERKIPGQEEEQRHYENVDQFPGTGGCERAAVVDAPVRRVGAVSAGGMVEDNPEKRGNAHKVQGNHACGGLLYGISYHNYFVVLKAV